MLVVSSMQTGGAERVASSIATGWVEQGWEVSIIVTFSGRGACAFQLPKAVRLIYLADEISATANPACSRILRLRALRRLISALRPEVVIAFLPHVNVAAILAAAGTGVPVIVSERTNPRRDTDATTLQRFLRWLLYRFADAVVVQTHAVEATVRDCAPGIDLLAVVPNPLPPTLPDRRAYDSGQGRYRIVASGRLVAEKQFQGLIRAFAAICRQIADWDLWIWGDGPLRVELERLVAELQLDDRVKIAGATKYLWEKMLESHLFVLTSSHEGFPNALLEAMALGLPAVAFDCEFGPRDISDGGQTAVLVTRDDWTALSAAIKHLALDARKRHRLAESGCSAVRAKYALPLILGQWEVVIDQVTIAPDSDVRES